MNAPIHEVRLRVWGDYACWTRPEMKVERVSYDVMTPSGARGILEAIFWKPAILWEVYQIDVLKPIRWISVRRNEVGAVISTRSALTAMQRGSGALGLYVEDERQQRAGLFLRDVEYIIHARFHLTSRAEQGENATKFAEMFRRRATRGQCFNQPYLGCREFSAFFELIPSDAPLPDPVPESRDLGWMLHDLEYQAAATVPRFFRAELRDGRLAVPPFDAQEVRA